MIELDKIRIGSSYIDGGHGRTYVSQKVQPIS